MIFYLYSINIIFEVEALGDWDRRHAANSPEKNCTVLFDGWSSSNCILDMKLQNLVVIDM